MKSIEHDFSHIRDIHIKWVRVYARIMSQTGLTLPKYSLLSQLVRFGPLSMTEASEKLHISKPALTNLVKRMAKNHFLKKIAHPKDHRSSKLVVLPKGKLTAAKAQASSLQFILKSLSSMSSAEQQTIYRFFSHVSESIDQALCNAKKGTPL